MEGGSRASHSRVGGDGTGILRGDEEEDGFGAEREEGNDHGRHSATSRPSAPTYRSMVSAMFLSLLPLPVAGYPRAEPRAMRRDRRRSGDYGKREMTRAEKRSTDDEGFERRCSGRVEQDRVVEVEEARVHNSQVCTPFHERKHSLIRSLATARFNADDAVQTRTYRNAIYVNHIFSDPSSRHGVTLQTDEGLGRYVDDGGWRMVVVRTYKR